MQLIRRFDERAGTLHQAGQIGAGLQLAVGEEAFIVGAVRALEDRDWLVSGFRPHATTLARGSEPALVLAELLGRTAGTGGGRGGPALVNDPQRRCLPGTGIDGGELSIAAGVALSSTYQGRSEVTLCMTGSAAVARGVFAETLTLGSTQRLPLVIAVAANQYGAADDTTGAADSALTRLTEGAGVKALRGNGMDIVEVHALITDAVRIARTERGPVVAELLTHRTREVSLADPKPYRGKEAVGEWKRRDPIVTFGDRLVEVGLIESSARTRLGLHAGSVVEQAVAAANRASAPGADALYDGLYADAATGADVRTDAEATWFGFDQRGVAARIPGPPHSRQVVR